MKALVKTSILLILTALGYSPIWESKSMSCYDLGFLGRVNIDKTSNRWHFIDGSGGGDNVTLVSLLKGLPTAAAEDWIASLVEQHPSLKATVSAAGNADEINTRIVRRGPITTSSLLKQIAHDRFPVEVAQQYCDEVSYCSVNHGSSGYGYGLPNISGGYGLITYTGLTVNVVKADIAYIKMPESRSTRCLLFMGLRDFLAYIATNKVLSDDSIVMFSASLVNRVIPMLQHYDEILYFVPKSRAKNLTLPILQTDCRGVIDMSPSYDGFTSYFKWYVAQIKHLAA